MNTALKSINILSDIYYQDAYADLYAGEEVSLFKFEYKNGENIFINSALKRPIRKIGTSLCDDGFFDLETPYGYGGCYSNSSDRKFLEKAMEAYRKRCCEERVIAEFIRFHPANAFHAVYSDCFDLLIDDRDVVVVDLHQDQEARWSGYHPKTRNILRKCAKGLSFKRSDDIAMFEKLYAETMLKNRADEFYYFDRAYYDGLLALDGVKLYAVSFESRVVAMAFIMKGEQLAHYHLSANATESLRLNANYYLLDQSFNMLRDEGAESFLLGGGRTADGDDTLLRFKRKFSGDSARFFIAGMIHNRKKYEEYVSLWESLNPGSSVRYFLKYRLRGE